jgi:hypothetical protein
MTNLHQAFIVAKHRARRSDGGSASLGALPIIASTEP